MAFTDASALLTQLRTQLVACASWTPGQNGVHYPDLTFSGASFPAAVVAELSRSSETYAAGAAGLPTGSLQITIYTTGTVGATEVLGQAILEELMAQASGIPFRSGSVGLCGASSDAMDAGQTTVNGIEINLDYGLEA